MDIDLTETSEIEINDLPDEILENIFTHISPYKDLAAVQLTCRRWNRIGSVIIHLTKQNFHTNLHTGTLTCRRQSPIYNENRRIVGYWVSERFGHMCCTNDDKMYVMGGTTATKTTFNDMWSFDLTTRLWMRVIPQGSYPSPKALGTFVNWNGNLVLHGGWAHPSPYPFMQPWRIFDELHIYNTLDNRWTLIESNPRPPPTAGHSATVHRDSMFIFGGRTFDEQLQSYPLSSSIWEYNFTLKSWRVLPIVENTRSPPPRYGQTQIKLDDTHIIIIGGCGGPNQIYSDIWVLTLVEDHGVWSELTVDGVQDIPFDFHYSGCKFDSTVVFLERSSPLSPFLAFLHFGAANSEAHNGVEFDRATGFNGRCSSGLKMNGGAMQIYTLDISAVLETGKVKWSKEPIVENKSRPNPRLLYSMVAGHGEFILFGGFYKEPNLRRCRVANDVFFLGV